LDKTATQQTVIVLMDVGFYLFEKHIGKSRPPIGKASAYLERKKERLTDNVK
jgi:hypothetical protein